MMRSVVVISAIILSPGCISYATVEGIMDSSYYSEVKGIVLGYNAIHENVEVEIPEIDTIVLTGSVKSVDIKDEIESSVRFVVHRKIIDNRIVVDTSTSEL